MFSYSAKNGAVSVQHDLVGEACKAADTDDVNRAISMLGYIHCWEIGDPEVAAIELFNSWGDGIQGRYSSLVHVTMGTEMTLYAMNTHYDTLHFLKEYVPIIKAICELHQMKFD